MSAPASILPLELERVRYAARGVELIPELTLRIPKGRRLILIGPNGAGKSLTLRLCHGLIAPVSGEVRWAAPARKRHAMVFQRPVLLRRSVRGNLAHALSLTGLPRAARAARADAALARFGLETLAERPARLLSGGEQQRLAVARAWALDPEVLFLDEPTAALDPGATRAIEAMIMSLSTEGMTIVMTTHDIAQARRLAEDVAFLHHGRLVETGPAAAFFERPRTEAARSFLAGDLLW